MHHPTLRPARARWSGSLVAVLLSLTASACTIPTDLPVLEQRWNVPAKTTSIGVADLLPSSVTIQNGAFVVAVSAPAAITRALYADCASCAAANGLTVPKPAFQIFTQTTTTLPTELDSAVIASGSIALSVRNNLSFDPLRPSATARGTGTLRVFAGPSQLGTLAISGAATALPGGGTTTFTIPLSGYVRGRDNLTVELTMDSPAGDPVTMSNQSLVITPTVTPIVLGATSAKVQNRTISSSMTFDLDLPTALTDRTDSAAVRLTISNPFPVTGSLTATFVATGKQPITKGLLLVPGPGTDEQRIALSGAEVRALAGGDVTLTITGSVSSGTPVRITPTQEVRVVSRLDLFTITSTEARP